MNEGVGWGWLPFFVVGPDSQAGTYTGLLLGQPCFTEFRVRIPVSAPRSPMSKLPLAPRDLLQQLQRPAAIHGPLVVDLRPQRQFRRARIAGSHNIPAAQLLSGEHPDRDLILIAEQAGQAEAVAEQLHDDGFHRRIQHLRGGVVAWREAGLNLESARGDASQSIASWPWALLGLQRGSRQLQRRSA